MPKPRRGPVRAAWLRSGSGNTPLDAQTMSLILENAQ